MFCGQLLYNDHYTMMISKRNDAVCDARDDDKYYYCRLQNNNFYITDGCT